MTSPQPKFREHIPAIIATATGAVGATVAGAYLGKAGAVTALVLGPLVSGTVTWWAERAIHRASAIAKAKAEAVRKRGRPLTTTEETSIIQRVDAQPRTRRARHWKTAALLVTTGVAAAFCTAATLQATAGTITLNNPPVTHPPSTPPAVTATVTATPSANATTPVPVPSPDLAPTPASTPASTQPATTATTPGGSTATTTPATASSTTVK